VIEALLLAATAAFHPPLGVPLAYVSREDRVIGGRTMHFESHRRITFARDGDGFVATIRFERAANDAGGDVAAMFQAAMASLADRPVTLRLDAAGTVTAVDDAEATWAALCDAIAQLPGTANQREHAAAFAGALRTLPEARRAGMLGSLVAPLIAGDQASLVPGSTQPAELHARPPIPRNTTLKGVQTVTRDADGRLVLHVHAAGQAPAADDTSAQVAADRDRVVDSATGLVLATHDRMSTTIGEDDVTTDTRTTLTIPVS
jgi:hypothetical protein